MFRTPPGMTRLALCWLSRLVMPVVLTLCAGPAFAQRPPAPPLTAQPQWITQVASGPGLVQGTFESRAAGAAVSYHIYVPPGYASEPGRRFPVIYWLHGSGGGISGVAPLARQFAGAMRASLTPPALVVFINGLAQGMYVDWKDGTRPIETIIISELIPHIDSTWRTIPQREGRLIEGFSMGGYGAARLGFKFPELFGAVSLLGAGPLQADLTRDAPRTNQARASDLMTRVYGGDQAYFEAVSPARMASVNAQALAAGTRVRIVIGERDETYSNNVAFHQELERLAIPHAWTTLPGVGHDPMATLTALGQARWDFYTEAFASTAPP
jgi:enterochelin esterase-like enzyme